MRQMGTAMREMTAMLSQGSTPRMRLTQILSDGNTVADFQPGNFAPTDTTNASAWLNSVTSGWGNPAVIAGSLLQASSAAQPTINADGSITCDGIAQYMRAAFTYAQPEEIWLVASQGTWTQNEYILDGGSGSANTGTLKQGLSSGGTTPQINSSTNGEVNKVGPNSDWAIGVRDVVRVVFDTTSSLITVGANAAVTGNAGAGNMGGITIGASGVTPAGAFFNGTFWEVILRNAVSSASKAAAIYVALKAIHGTP